MLIFFVIAVVFVAFAVAVAVAAVGDAVFRYCCCFVAGATVGVDVVVDLIV